MCSLFVASFLFTSNANATGRAGVCGSAHGGSFSTAPTDVSKMCVRGQPTTATYSSGNWVWTCQGSGTSGNANCSATNCGSPPSPPVNGVCGSAADTLTPTEPSSNLCNSGSASPRTYYPGDISCSSSCWGWTCSGSNGGNPINCYAREGSASVNGSCKTYGGTHTSQPATNTSTGCTQGTFVEVADDSTYYKWRCNGTGSPAGTSANCQATKYVAPTPPSCTAASGTSCVGGTILAQAYDGSHGMVVVTGDPNVDTLEECQAIGGNCMEYGRRGHDGEQGADDTGGYWACLSGSTGVGSSSYGPGCPEAQCQSLEAYMACDGVTAAEAASVCESRTDGTGVSCEWEYNWYGPQQDTNGDWWCTEVFTGDNCGNTYCYSTEAPITKSGGVVSVGSYGSNDRWCN